MLNNVLMEEMTWREIEQAVKAGKNTVILVAASIEQHGPHLPTATDTIIGYALAERVAEELGNALVAPVIRPGLSEHHIGFPGTLTLRLKTFVKVLEEYCQCLKCHGFKNTVIFTSHGGNGDGLTAFVPSIAKKLAPDMGLLLVGTMEKSALSMQQFLAKHGVTPPKAGVHAGFAETSIMLALKPELVTMDKAAPGLVDENFYLPDTIARSQMDSFLHGIKSQSPNGILGDPTGSDAELGKALLKLKIRNLAEEIELNLNN